MKKTDLNIKSIWHNKTSAIVFVIFIFIFANLMPLFAVENKYNNQLLKLNVDKSTKDRINITVTTSKPYKIKLSPMKRSDNEYVILLPDTYHSITTKPDISKIADLQDIDVKLIPYIGSQNNNNGYTKITVRTKSGNTKLNINDEVSGQKPIINSELSRLIGRTASKPSTKNIISNKPLLSDNKITVNNSHQKRVIPKPEQVNKISAKKINNTEKSKNSNTAPKLALAPQKTVVQTEKPVYKESTQNIKQSEPKNQDIAPLPSKDLQPVANTNPISVNKEIPKLEKKHIKSDGSPIKLILISLIALLILFIVVIRYFKSLLMKQMHQAEKKITAEKAEVVPPQKYQDTAKSSPPQPVIKKPVSKPISVPTPVSRNKQKAVNNNSIKVLKGFQIENDKGLYLIQTKYKKILIGIIDSEVFLLKEFNNIDNPKFIVKKEKTLRTKSVYYVQIDNWRSLVSVAQDDIKLELILERTLTAR